MPYVRGCEVGSHLREGADHRGAHHQAHTHCVHSEGAAAAGETVVLHRRHPFTQTDVLEQPVHMEKQKKSQ